MKKIIIENSGERDIGANGFKIEISLKIEGFEIQDWEGLASVICNEIQEQAGQIGQTTWEVKNEK